MKGGENVIGIVDVGGGMRGVYSSGIYDCFLDEGFMADYCIGVSAGAANLITYIAGQRGRTLEFYREYPKRKDYMSLGNLIRKGVFLDLDYVYGTLSNEGGETPLDYHAFKRSKVIFMAVATRGSDAKSHYFTSSDVHLNDYSILKATCALPVVCKNTAIGGEVYFDGGLSNPMPVEKAFRDGCDKVILILTKPREEYMKPIGYAPVLKVLMPKYKNIAYLTMSYHERCAEALRRIAEYERESRVIVLEPRDCYGMKTLTTATEPIMKLYEAGYRDAKELLSQKIISLS